MTGYEMQMIIALSARATPDQVDVFIDHVINERTLKDMTDEYGLSHARLGQLAKRVRHKAKMLVNREQRMAA